MGFKEWIYEFLFVNQSKKISSIAVFKNHTLASGPITSWQIDGETVETVTDFIYLESKITVYSDCSRKIKMRLFLGRTAMTNLDSVLKTRDNTLAAKVCIVKVTLCH